MESGDWTEATIETLLKSGAIIGHKDGNHGAQYPRADEFGRVGIPFLTAKLLAAGMIDIDGAPRLPEDKADKLRLGFVEPGDVLLSHNATVGRVAVIPNFKGRLLIGTSLTYFRTNPKKISPRYLAAYMAGRDFQNQLAAVMSQTTRNQVPITAQRRLRLVVPPIATQDRIADILGALDDKIDLNRRMNATLETLARTLFQNWFVDVDADGDSGETDAITLGDLIYLARKPVNPAIFPDEVFDHYSLPAFDAGRLPAKHAGREIKSNKTLVPPDAVLLSKLNPRIPRVWFPDVAVNKRSIASTEFLVAQPKKGVSRELLFGLFTSSSFLKTLEGMVTGTSGSHQRVTPDAVLRIPIALPDVSVIERFTRAVEPLLRNVQSNIEESRSLAEIRDTLLPKLLSRELGVENPGN